MRTNKPKRELAQEAGADDIEAILDVYDETFATGTEPASWWIEQKKSKRKQATQSILNLLETERERVWDLVEKEVIGEDEPNPLENKGYYRTMHRNKFRAEQREVIERLRLASVRKANSSPDDKLNNNAPGVEEKQDV